MTGIQRAFLLTLTVLALIAAGAVAARADTIETFRFGYAATGTWANTSQVDDNAGCRRKIDWVGSYGFLDTWTLKVIRHARGISIYRQATFNGGKPLSGHPSSLDLKGSQATQPGQECQWAGGTNDTGSFQCGDTHPQLLYDSQLHISLSGGKTLIFRAPAFITYNPMLRGTVAIPSLKTTGCLAIGYSPGMYAVGPDIEVRIPIKAATLFHLQRGHYFNVFPKLGHYTVRGDQTGHSCFLLTKGPSDFCRVTQDSYRGQVIVKRIT